MKNVFYFWHINEIGGIETFFYYLAKKYQDWDITIYYKTGDVNQIRRLKKYVRVKRFEGQIIECDYAFFNFNLETIDNFKAKKYFQIAHGDYKAMGIRPNTHKKINQYLGVSKQVCKTFKEMTGYDTQLVYNPIVIDEPKKVLRLLSATRLTKEKGKQRIEKLAKKLDQANIPYVWTIFTDDVNAIKNPNIAYMRPRLDIINYIADADYLVQLSDNEGYCYSVAEALSVGTPVIVTDVPVFKEIGVNKNNGFILDFDMSDIPIEDIYRGLPKFEYIPKKDTWENILKEGKSTYKEEKEMKVLVKCIKRYIDTQQKDKDGNYITITTENEPFVVDAIRAEELVAAKVCEVIEKIEEPKQEEVKTETAKKPTKKTSKKKK